MPEALMVNNTEVIRRESTRVEAVERPVTEVIRHAGKVFVVERVKQGVPGPPGGSNTYRHQQSTPLATWTVVHNMGTRPAVTVTDHLDNQVLADVRYIDDNILQITHGLPMIGNVYCN